MPGEVTLNSKSKEGVLNGDVLFMLTYLLHGAGSFLRS